MNHLNVVGKATNFTAQRDTTPFGTSLTGMKYIRRATFGGNADAVALDVNGPIGKVTFKRGLGDPTGVFNGKVAVPNTGTTGTTQTQYIPATNYGVPLGSEGYPAAWPAGRRDPGQADRHGEGRSGQLHHPDRSEPQFRATQTGQIAHLLPGEPRDGPHELGDHHRRFHRQGPGHGQSAQLRDQDGVQLSVVHRGAAGHPKSQPDPAGSPARRPGQQRGLGDRPAHPEQLRGISSTAPRQT